MCELLQHDVDSHMLEQIVCIQAKEKFGGFRFYTESTSEYQKGIIQMTTHLLDTTCENCGASNAPKVIDKGWAKTLCDYCNPNSELNRKLKENMNSFS